MKNVYHIDNKPYAIEINMVNPNEKFFNLNWNQVKELFIQEHLLSIFPSGYILIENKDDILERSVAGFTFRGDNRDILTVRIKALTTDTESFNFESVDVDDPFYLNMTFRIVGNENVFIDNVKFKRLLLQDNRMCALYETVTDYSSYYEGVSNKLYTDSGVVNLTDKQRYAHTGNIIKNVILRALENAGDTDVKFDSTWDIGKSAIFFNGYSGSTALDSVLTLVQEHVSSNNNDTCILRQERNGTFTFYSLGQYFKYALSQNGQSGVLHLDRYIIPSQLDVSDSVDNISDARNATDAPVLGQDNFINAYSFLNVDGMDTQVFGKPRVTTSYDDSHFVVNFADVHMPSIRKQMNSLYATSISDNYEIASFDNILRSNFSSLDVILTTQKGNMVDYAAGAVKTMKDLFFMNQELRFDVKGSIHRQPGRFITIQTNGPQANDAFSSRILGQHFIVGVNHTFTPQSFHNAVYAIKPYTNKSILNNIPVV